MNLPVRRRSLRRHSTSTLQNVNKNSKGSAIGNCILNGRISKKRLSIDEQSLHQDENNKVVKNQNNKLNRTTILSKNQSCELLPLRPLARLSEFPDCDKSNKFSSIRSSDVYESLMDIQQTLDEIEPDVRRRSKRLCVVNKQNLMPLKSSQENVNCLTVLNNGLRQNRRRSTNFDEEEFDVKPISKKKRRKLSIDDTLQYNNDLLYSSVTGEPTNSINKMETQNSLSGSNDLMEIKKYYLDKSIPNTTCLETIFEENSNSNKAMGKRKKKRFIPFPEIIEKKTRKNSECMKKLNSRRKKSVDVALNGIQGDDFD
ncbi:uncharacterized protein LOC123313264 isoform X2 [Coccinella septempunctata]|uniref:uncharacterized protein LOC123313264 isoform X2 n=1 Tax=Coccinella septempunctata TaxID=41139 RepID=UPI001D092153|nr:uncharacterized protein LOC123313264 isoform X2 [Coccinella septempunctata]